MSEDDCVALWSLPAFAPRDVLAVGGGVACAGAPVAWLTVGRGFGASGFVPLPGAGKHLLVDGRAGRAWCEALEPDELAALDLLRRRSGRIAVDELLCEAGLATLHRAVCALRGVPAPRIGAGTVVARALAGRSAECARSLSIFCALLGDAAGQAALAFGARGGVYVGGALVPRFGDGFARSPFRRRFEARGRERDWLRAVPTVVVRSGAMPRVAGAARAAATSGSPG